MTAVAFDTLKLARKLRDTAQMTQVQAEGVADALAEAMSGAELATKSDISEIKRDIRELELKIDARFNEVDGRFKELIKEVDGRFKELIKEVDGRFKEVDGGFQILLERIDRRAAESDARIQALKTAQFRWLLVGLGSVIATIIGAAGTIIHYLPKLLNG